MKVSKVYEYYPGVFSYVANVPGEKNKQFVFTYSEDRLNGVFHESHESVAYFNWDTEHKKNFVTDTPNEGEQDLACDVLHDDGSTSGFFNHDSLAETSYKSSNANSYSSAAPLTAVDDSITIDLLLLYTNKAEIWAQTSQFGNINNALAQAMAQAQAILDNSETGVEIRVVHTYKTNYDDDGSDISAGDHLRRLTHSPENPLGDSYSGYMEEAHALRDEYGADLVAAILSEPNTGGIAWRLNSSGGSSTRGFSVNRIEQGSGLGSTIVHEVGHNMGNSHSRTQESNAASGGGGLFHYSAGYQDFTNGFATTMAYSQQGVSRVPIFSSPDLTWEGVPTGTNNIQTPQNSARSIREIKRTIASYRPTIQAPPVASTSTDIINVNLNREDELEVTFDISNTGESALVWDVDFKFAESTVAKSSSKANLERIQPKKEMMDLKAPANYSRKNTSAKANSDNSETLLYETSFEGTEGFARGSFSGLSEWRELLGNEFVVSNENARSGSQHLRLEATDDGPQGMASPFFGYQTFGTYEIELDFLVGGEQPGNEDFYIWIYDGKTGGFTTGVIITSNTIYFSDLDENGNRTFLGGTVAINPSVYYNMRILMDAEDQLVRYYINNQEVAANQYIEGFTPGLMRFYHLNEASGAHIDIDNVEITRITSPYNWLSTTEEAMGGVTKSGESSSVSMMFNTMGMSAGVYETTMTIKTNSPDQPLLEIPVTLEVNQEVSNEASTIPDRFTLSQNYPNPFNPSTNIRYSLESSQKVELTIFNMQGQKVTTLQNGVQPAGSHTITFNANNLASGVYMYQLKAGAQSLTRQMVLIK
jgi:hypothetical protein